MDPDVETLADDDLLAGDGGEAERLEAEAEADLLRDRLRLAVINIATSEGRLISHHLQFPRSFLAHAISIGTGAVMCRDFLFCRQEGGHGNRGSRRRLHRRLGL
jgi:centromere protein S